MGCCAWHKALAQHIERRAGKDAVPDDMGALCSRERRLFQLLGAVSSPAEGCMGSRLAFLRLYSERSSVLVVKANPQGTALRRSTLLKALLDSLRDDFDLRDLPEAILTALGTTASSAAALPQASKRRRPDSVGGCAPSFLVSSHRRLRTASSATS
eukprot:TRINITY_DN3003_c0_g1_i1.p1 TRINITY_DN3003_c0_g1~~TRINITY_DN3003_c0_g1_i1.p1  ORF type:complete len:156 (+),score=18.48 TRINITY_DN3003_c0_g1_i1:181-648(+)